VLSSAAVMDSQVVKTTRAARSRATTGDAPRWAQAPHPGGHERADVGRERVHGADLPNRDGLS